MIMNVICDVFITMDGLVLDHDIYRLWLDGYSAEEATTSLVRSGALLDGNFSYDIACASSEVSDQYRSFFMVEKYLQLPGKMFEQCHLPLDFETQAFLIESYYSVDEAVIRELLGKKLSSKTRKDMADVSEKTRVRLRTCLRQFDNFRRVFKTVEGIKGSLVSNIQTIFQLPEELARKYAASVFITINRFETGKKRLHYLTFDDFVFCADQMITHWSYSSLESQEDGMDTEVDRVFLQNLRDFKILLDREHLDELKSQIVKKLHGLSVDKSTKEADVKGMLKVLINIAVDLNHSRDLRDLFVDVVEKFIEPYRSAKWSLADVEKFLGVTAEIVRKYDTVKRHQPSLVSTWNRYTEVIAACIKRMYRH